MMEEVWRDIKGFEGYYQVSSCGKVRSLIRKGTKCNRTLKFSTTYNGYYQLCLSKPSVRKNLRVNRLVAEAFVSNPGNKPEVNHKDGIKTHNEDYNLEWCTRVENCNHKNIVLGKHFKGERHHLAKLKEKDIQFIRNCNFTQKEIGAKYSISQQHVSSIINRTRWTHI